MRYKFLQRGLKKEKRKKNTAPLNAPRNDCSSKLSDRNDFPGKNARERRDLAKHRRILIIRVREKKREGERKKEKNEQKEAHSGKHGRICETR